MTAVLVSFAFVLLVVCAACFSALETALQVVREKGERGGKHRELLRDPVTLLSEVLLLCGITNLLLAAAGLWIILNPLSAAGWNPWLGALALFGGGLLVVELIPNALALRSPERALCSFLPLFVTMRRLITPLAASLRKVSDKLVTAFTPRKLKPRKAMLAEEVETLIDMREEQGSITPDEAALLHGIINLQGLIAKDVITPRVDLPLMPHDSSDSEALNMLESARHRFVAVFDEKADAIASLVDVEKWKLSSRPHWSQIAAAPVMMIPVLSSRSMSMAASKVSSRAPTSPRASSPKRPPRNPPSPASNPSARTAISSPAIRGWMRSSASWKSASRRKAWTPSGV
jgi:putative hemolysin